MSFSTRTWFILSLLCFMGAVYFARVGNVARQKQAPQKTNTNGVAALPAQPLLSLRTNTADAAPQDGFSPRLRPQAASLPQKVDTNSPFWHRLSNTSRSLAELTYSDSAILLRNALYDSASAQPLEIPQHLRSQGDPGSYVVQARGPTTDAFRAMLKSAGAEIVSYVPNNAYLVRADAAGARHLAASPLTQTVLPWEPYYKLTPKLLELAIEQKPLPDGAPLRVAALPGQDEQAAEGLRELGGTVIQRERSPFGTLFVTHVPPDKLVDVAQLSSVQAVEPVYRRAPANDLSRVRVRVATNSETANNHLNLTGQGVKVGVNDTGVDVNHPDLGPLGRVMPDTPATGMDVDGHGTHVAGIIASTGASGPLGTNVPGSASNANFRGIAPAAQIYAQPIDILTGPLKPEPELQEATATNGVRISNNSWGYPDAFEYNFSSASWDAAVRDSAPGVEGPQEVTYVFAAGNEGGGRNNGTGGVEDSITAPANAKNVISVGALEQPRNITNEVVDTVNDTTNAPFVPRTDSDDQVAAFSSRGNVGIGIEGPFGRFKPDLVAPGVFTVSTRASGWASNQLITTAAAYLEDETVPVGNTNIYTLIPGRLPNGAPSFEVRVRVIPNGRSPVPFPTNSIYVGRNMPPPPSQVAVRSNILNFPVIDPDDTYYIGIGNNFHQDVHFDLQVVVLYSNAPTAADRALVDLNAGLGQRYRYESGTSMAAPVVSGVLALMQEFFQRLQRTNSPALMKALLINGARSVGTYNLEVQNVMNLQGWGVVNLTNSLPGYAGGNLNPNAWPVRFFEQDATNSLVTGQSHTRILTIQSNAPALRITLAWTDPPANPSVGVKLVNDLDLIVSNITSGASQTIYVGNQISGDFSSAQPGTNEFTTDVVNNVENVFIQDPQANDQYAITVRARRVNVNAVTAHHPGEIAQDYALVISAGSPGDAPIFDVSPTPTIVDNPTPPVLVLSNSVPVFNLRIGANPPGFTFPNTNGTPNQWRFFEFFNTGSTNTNVAFFVFLTPNLGRERTSKEADIDLYVSFDSTLTNLNPAAVANAFTSKSRGGTEAVVFTLNDTNILVERTFYVGVKSEDQQAANFGIFAFAGSTPFSERTTNGVVVNGLNIPVNVPDGSSEEASGQIVFAYSLDQIQIGNVIVTNELFHPNGGDFIGLLLHNGQQATLNAHRAFEGLAEFIYDDSNSGQIIQSTPTDAPGTLRNFWGQEGLGTWQLVMVDDSLIHGTGSVNRFTMLLEPPENPTNGIGAVILPNRWFYTFVDVPVDATRMTIEVGSQEGPVELYVGRDYVPDEFTFDHSAVFAIPGGTLEITPFDTPPLAQGLYFIGLRNPNSRPIPINLKVTIERNLFANQTNIYSRAGGPLIDDAVTTSLLTVTNAREIVDTRVGVRIDHPRASDLVLHLVSPGGTRVLLSENRGGTNATGYGTGIAAPFLHTIFTDNTNLTVTPIKFGTAPFTNSTCSGVAGTTNVFPAGTPAFTSSFEDNTRGCDTNGLLITPGVPFEQWISSGIVRLGCTNAHTGAKWVSLTNAILDTASAFPANPNQDYLITFAYSKVPSTNDPGYVAAVDLYVDFTNRIGSVTYSQSNSWDNFRWETRSFLFRPTRTLTPMTFRTPPGTNGIMLDTVVVTPITTETIGCNFFLPEEPLRQFRGENAFGTWRLEVWDNRSGATGGQAAPPRIRDWRLDFDLANIAPPVPIVRNGECVTGTLQVSNIVVYRVNVPFNATRATNTLNSSNVLVMTADATTLATGFAPPDDYGPATGTSNTTLVITTGSVPPLRQGLFYYVALRNTNQFAVDYQFCVNFDNAGDPDLSSVVVLTNIPPNPACITTNIAATNLLNYYSFDASSNAVAVFFDLYGMNGNADLFVRHGLPLPVPGNARESRNRGNTNEHIAVGAGPTTQIPGRWYIGVLNMESTNVNYTLCVQEVLGYLPVTNNLCLSNALAFSNHTHYYRIPVSNDTGRLEIELTDLMGDADLYVRQIPPPSQLTYDYASTNGGATNELITLDFNSFPVPLLPGDWYAAVVSRSPMAFTYCIEVRQFPDFDPNAIRLFITNGLAMTPPYVDLGWFAPDYLRFHVEYSDSLSPAAWQPVVIGGVPHEFAPAFGPGTGFMFRDDGSLTTTNQPPVLPPMRFYRLRLLP